MWDSFGGVRVLPVGEVGAVARGLAGHPALLHEGGFEFVEPDPERLDLGRVHRDSRVEGVVGGQRVGERVLFDEEDVAPVAEERGARHRHEQAHQ